VLTETDLKFSRLEAPLNTLKFFFLAVLGFELKSFTFARQVFYHLSHPTSPFSPF
jgi:hypothetical protein